MCSQFYHGEIARPDCLFEFIVADAHELVYREVFAFVHRLHIVGHFREKREETDPELGTHREIFEYWRKFALVAAVALL